MRMLYSLHTTAKFIAKSAGILFTLFTLSKDSPLKGIVQNKYSMTGHILNTTNDESHIRDTSNQSLSYFLPFLSLANKDEFYRSVCVIISRSKSYRHYVWGACLS